MILKQATKEKLPFLSKIWGFLLVVLTVIFLIL